MASDFRGLFEPKQFVFSIFYHTVNIRQNVKERRKNIRLKYNDSGWIMMKFSKRKAKRKWKWYSEWDKKYKTMVPIGWMGICGILLIIKNSFPATRFIISLILIGGILFWGITTLHGIFEILTSSWTFTKRKKWRKNMKNG